MKARLFCEECKKFYDQKCFELYHQDNAQKNIKILLQLIVRKLMNEVERGGWGCPDNGLKTTLRELLLKQFKFYQEKGCPI